MNLVAVFVSIPHKRMEFAARRGLNMREAKREMRAIVAEIESAGMVRIGEDANQVRFPHGARVWIG